MTPKELVNHGYRTAAFNLVHSHSALADHALSTLLASSERRMVTRAALQGIDVSAATRAGQVDQFVTAWPPHEKTGQLKTTVLYGFPHQASTAVACKLTHIFQRTNECKDNEKAIG